jgi:hypothetical protein
MKVNLYGPESGKGNESWPWFAEIVYTDGRIGGTWFRSKAEAEESFHAAYRGRGW